MKRHSDQPATKEDTFENILAMMEAQWGHLVKSFWVYDGDLCPCCSTIPIDYIEDKGNKSVSLNFFMYRDRGALIAYILCGECVKPIMANPYSAQSTKMHKVIEENLKGAYHRHLASFDA
ncbi:MAG: hypothetical protein ACYC7E_03935 [Armatimonadota bacterium]